jgi:hypothetical protein
VTWMVSAAASALECADPAAGLTEVGVRWSGARTAPAPAGPSRDDRQRGPAGDHDQVFVGHVTDQDADDAEGKVELCGDLGDRQKVVAEDGDGPLLHSQLRGQIHTGGGEDQRLDRQGVVGGAGTPAGHGIGADPLRVGCSMVGAGHGVPYLAGRLHLREPGCCWLSAGEAEATARSVMDSVGMLGAHGGRAAWSSALSPGVRTSPVRLTSTVIS